MCLIQTRSGGHCGGHDHDDPLEHCIFSLDNKPVPNPTERPVWLKGGPDIIRETRPRTKVGSANRYCHPQACTLKTSFVDFRKIVGTK